MIIFYFLYFFGLNYSTIARITLKDFKKGFNILTLKKRKIRKYFIPDVIKNKLCEYFHNKNNKSIFFFYDSYHDSNSYTRTTLIKNNIRIILESADGVSSETVKYLLSLFSKMRKSKRLSSKYYFLFDNNCELKNLLKDEILNDKFESSFDSGSIISYKEKRNPTPLYKSKI